MYGKIENNQLIIAGNIIKGKDETGYYTITNPTGQQYIEKGYKVIVYDVVPEYDIENEKIVEQYDEQTNEIIIHYNKINLTDEEHNNVILKEIEEEENKMTQRYIRNAALGDSFAIGKLQEIENNIAALRAKLRG